MVSATRKPFDIGGSKGITLPQGMIIGDEVSIAGNDKLLLVNTTGEFRDNELQEFFLEYIEPKFQQWWENARGMKKVYIPERLWERLYKVAGKMKSRNDTYAEAQQTALLSAIYKYCEDEGVV